MKSFYLGTVVVALAFSMGACQKRQPEVIDTTSPDPMGSQLEDAAPVELPPAIVASVSLRCKDNSILFVDFFKGGARANLYFKRGGTPIVLNGSAKDDSLTGGGYTLTGNQDQISLTKPGTAARSCHR